ncbi:MAG TPA: squalene synthase HpnC [Burkholderiaceae bacterium]|nr:squalene synthase HpnC [Burkholderiaceae bacterium]
MPVDHYENFPVASILLPARLRAPVEAIYHWARYADDLADEGDAPAEQRIAALRALDDDLYVLERGESPSHEISRRLANHWSTWRLPAAPFHDLLSAFMQDVTRTRYSNTADLHDYCRRSANPVGRLVLHLHDAGTPKHLEWSDAICTGLQLANFWQDVAIDWKKNRVYIPQDAMHRYGVRDDDIDQLVLGRPVNKAWRALMQHQIDTTRTLLESGAPLARALPGRIGLELRLVVLGGLRILERIQAVDFDVFRHRPTLGKRDWAQLFPRALFALHPFQ